MANEKQEATQMPEWASAIIESNKALVGKVETLEKENKMFREMAGQNAIRSWQEQQKDKATKFAHFKKWNDKIIIGWGKLDYSKFNPKSPDSRNENIFMDVTYLDGSTEKLNYSDFSNIKDLEEVKILERGAESTNIEFKSGETLMVSNKFLNA